LAKWVDSLAKRQYNIHLATKEAKMQAVTFNTNGKGYWSNTAKAVRIVDMRLGYVSDERDFGELCVYFNTEDWDVNALGLIYTDKQFKAELNAFLVAQGLCAVEYSEQGMQDEEFVSCDVGEDFITAWDAKFKA
jgi:hypothetical protein